MARHVAIAAAVWLGGSCAAPPVRDAADPPAPAATAVQADNPCPHVEGEDAKRFEHAAFGPPAMSFELLGQAWWQWDAEGHAFEGDGGTIWVVVYDGLDANALATRFPVRPDALCDHRYVALADARAYLLEHIEELEDPGVPEFAALRTELQQTLESIRDHFD